MITYTKSKYDYKQYYAWWPLKVNDTWIWFRSYYKLFSPFMLINASSPVILGYATDEEFLLLLLGDQIDVRIQ